MIRTFHGQSGDCRVIEGPEGLEGAPAVAWIDLAAPTRDEKEAVTKIVGVPIPSAEEMAEIEASSRIYIEGEAAVMTVPVLVRTGKDYPESGQITFVLTPRHLVTVRYIEPTSFTRFVATARHAPDLFGDAQATFAGLVDAMTARIADVLEEIGRDLDRFSRSIFVGDAEHSGRDFKKHMQRLGRNGDIVSKLDESLVGLSRAIGFARELDHVRGHKRSAHKLRTVARDVEVLIEHSTFLSDKITFLLDALLGMINIEQNAIIKIFSVVAVMFLPPTLIASIYGMNFEHMPELGLWFAYPLAIVAMIVSMILPYLYFKRRGWI